MCGPAFTATCVPIPDDCTVKAHHNFTITNNWSMYDARLKGQMADQPIFELFVDSGMLAMTSMQNQSIHA